LRDYKLTKQALKTLTHLAKDNTKVASSIKSIITKLRDNSLEGESLKGYALFKIIRAGKFRLIYTLRNDVLLIAIIEKRETVYATFEHLFKNSSMFDD
jgi:mRNA-degrading endonuclease RelE of RelBE toxin-antitoxin system